MKEVAGIGKQHHCLKTDLSQMRASLIHRNNVISLHDNILPYTSRLTKVFLAELAW